MYIKSRRKNKWEGNSQNEIILRDKMNWREMCYRHFRNSKLILFKEGLEILFSFVIWRCFQFEFSVFRSEA